MTLKKIIIGVLITIVLAVIGVFVYLVIMFNSMGFSGKNYTPDDLVANFNTKRSEIYDLKTYFNKIMPKYKIVEIEFKNDDEISRLVITPVDAGKGSDLTVQFQEWNLPVRSKKIDSVLTVLGWTNSTLAILKQKLDNANCISIDNGEPVRIGFKRSGLGMYFFDVFDKSIPPNLKTRYNDSCTYIYANEKLVLEYGGGAVGSQCFFKKK